MPYIIGPSAFNRWMYTLNLLNTSNTILGNDYQYNDLLPNMVYIIDIFPSMPGSVGSDDDILMSSWIVMTVNDGQYACSLHAIITRSKK